jgi:hypothetical protein
MLEDTRVLLSDEAAHLLVPDPTDLIIAFRKIEVVVHPVAGALDEAEEAEVMEILTEV